MRNNKSKILVIKLSALGDFIQALGSMRAIRQHHPDAEITLLTTKPFENFAWQSNYFNHIWLDERPKFNQPKKWLSLRKKLNQEKFSRVYDLQNNDRTSIYLRLFSPKPEWVGAAKGASHRNASPDRKSGLAFYGHVQTLKIGGIHHVDIDRMEWINADISRFDLKQPYALIVPGCAPTRPEKRWPADYYSKLCNYFHEQNIRPVILGTESEQEITGKIAKACPAALDLTGKTSLFDIVPLARNAVIAVGNDTGPMHMIAPTNCKTLVLFSGKSEPAKHSPLGDNVHTIQKDDLSDLKPDQVLEKITELL